MAASGVKHFYRAWVIGSQCSVTFWEERRRAEWMARVLLKVDEARPVRVEEIPAP